MKIMKKIPFITRKKVVIYIHIWILRKKISKTKLPARCEFYNEPEKKNTDNNCKHTPVAWVTLIIIIKIVVYMFYCRLMFLKNSDRCFWITIN